MTNAWLSCAAKSPALQLLRASLATAALFCAAGIAHADSATFAWDRASSHTNLSAFILKYGPTSGSYTGQVSVATNQTTGTINGLAAGRTYFVTVTAVNTSSVESDPSNEISYTVPGTIVNAVPVANGASTSTPEDQSRSITLTGSDTDGDPLTFSVVTPPANGSLTGTAPNLTYVPTANFFGSDSFTFRAIDGITNSAPATISITVSAVNDSPTLSSISNRTLATNAGPQTVSLAGITTGAANESQTLSVTASSSNTGLIPNPTVTYSSPDSTGSLAFTPAANSGGIATITVTVNDGQSQNNTVTRTFNVTVGTVSTTTLFVEAESGTVASPMVRQNDTLASGGQFVTTTTDETGTLALTFNASQAGDYVVWCRVLSVDNGTDSFYVWMDSGAEDVYSTSPNAWSPDWQWTQLGGLNAGTPRIFTLSAGNHTLRFRGRESTTGLDALYITTDRSFVPTTAGPNRRPTLNAISNVTINEDAGQQTVNLAGIGTGAAGETQTLTVTATSSNPGLIPNPTVNYTSPNATGSLNFTPTANSNGTSTITVTVDDGQAISNLFSRTFTVTVTAVNDTPTLNALSTVSITEDAAQQTVNLSGIGSGAVNESQTLTVTATSGNTSLIPNPTVTYTSPGTTGTLRFTPVANASGSAVVTVTVDDGQSANDTVTRTFTVNVASVNDLPTISNIANQTVNESTATAAIAFTVGDLETAAASLTLSGSSSNPGLVPNGNIVLGGSGANRTVTVTPVTGLFGSATITIQVTDGNGGNATDTFTLTVNGVNNAPTLNALGNLTINEDAAQQTVNLSGIGSGATNEAQTLTVTATSSNPTLIPNPTVSYTSPNTTGSISFQPATNANGTATITVTVNDGQAQSATLSRTFTVTVNPVNDSPTISDIANQTVNEGTATAAIAIAIGDLESSAASLTLAGGSSNPTLVPNANIVFGGSGASRTVRVTPAATQFGTAVITVTVTDAGGATASDTFTLTVSPLNRVPTLNALGNLTINEDAAQQTVNLSGITSGATNESQTLTVTAISSNPALIPNPTASYTSPNTTGSISFQPVTNASGAATITVTVNDGQAQNASFSRTFTVTVNPVNDSPTISDIANQTINESGATAALPLTVGDLETAAASLTLSGSSSNPTLVPNANIVFGGSGASRTVRVTPAATQFGTAIITVTVTDAGGATASDAFTVTVSPLNQAPTLNTIGNLTINEDAAQQTVSLAGISTGAANENDTLVLTATSSNTGLIPNPVVSYSSPSATGSLTFTPAANASGSATITVAVNDGQSQSNTITRTFTVTVNSVNDSPTLGSLVDFSINEDSGQQVVNLSGITSGAANENQTLTVTATSANTSLIPNPTVNYFSPNATGSLSLRSATNATGSALITVTVNDGQSQNNTTVRTFTVTVIGVNDAPAISSIADQNVNENTPTASLPFTVADTETAAMSLNVTASSANQTLVPNNNIVLGGSGANRSITVTPATDQSGSALITVLVSDGNGGTATELFTVYVNSVNQPPTLDPINGISINEDAGPQTVNLAGISTGAFDELQTLSITATSSNPGLIPNPAVNYTSPNFTGSLELSPVANANGTAVITVTIDDGQSQNNTVVRTFTVNVVAINDSPSISNLADQSINQNTATATLPFTIGDAETSVSSLTLAVNSSDPALVPNTGIVLGGSGSNRTVRVTPASGQFGSAVITITVADGTGGINSDSFILTVNAVNFPPTLNALADMTIVEDSGNHIVSLTGITSGSAQESQTLTITATSSDPDLIPDPTVSYSSPSVSGTILLTPLTNAYGAALITVTVSDGQANNSTLTRTFTVTVNAVNDTPTLNPIANVTLNENAPLHSVPLTGIGPGAANEDQTLIVTAVSSNPGLIPNPTVSYFSPNTSGNLTFTPVTDANGTATITVTVNDGQAQNNSVVRTFNVTVSGANSAPTITDLPDRSVPMNGVVSGVLFTIGDAETAPENLTVRVTSSNNSLVWTNNILMNGSSSNKTVSIITSSGQHGFTVITFTVIDPEGASTSDSFVLTVVPPNIQPTMDPIASRFMNEDSGPQVVALTGISPGGAEENQEVIISAISTDPSVIPHPVVDYTNPDTTGSLIVTPASNQVGSATIIVTVNDGQSLDNRIVRTFGITILGINDPPTISPIPNQVVQQNTSTGAIPFILDDLETPEDNLAVVASSSDQTLIPDANIVLGGSDANRTVTVNPATGRSGTATITIFASDGALSGSTAFQVIVGPPNSPPTIESATSLATDSYTEAEVPIVVADRESRPDDLILTAASQNPTVLPNANIRFVGNGSNRVVRCKPVAGKSGSVTIDIGVSDGRAITHRNVRLSVAAGNGPTAPISIRRNGQGTVKPLFDGQVLTVGKTYSITAVPAAHEVFVRWSGGVTSSTPSISFVMVSNLVLEVTFTNNPYVAIKGSYNGLFHEASEVRQESAGNFVLTPTERGAYTGKLKLGSKSYSLSGPLSLALKGTNTIVRKGTNSLVVELDFGASSNQVVGRVTDGVWESPMLGDRALFSTKTNPCPHLGSYTFILPGQSNPADGPQGDGHGTIKVDGNGLATLAGTLADGTKMSHKVPLSVQGQWPVYIPLYSGLGSIVSWQAFADRPTDDLTGLLSWIKLSQPKTKIYPGGFTNETVSVGSIFIRPSPSTAPVITLTDGQVTFSGGNLSTNFTNAVSMTANKITNLGGNKLSLSISTSSGLFSGSVTDPSNGKSLKFSGALLQKQNSGSGFLLGTNRSSLVTFGE